MESESSYGSGRQQCLEGLGHPVVGDGFPLDLLGFLRVRLLQQPERPLPHVAVLARIEGRAPKDEHLPRMMVPCQGWETSPRPWRGNKHPAERQGMESCLSHAYRSR